MTVAFAGKGTRVAFGGGSSAAPSKTGCTAGNLVVLYVGLSRGDTANTAIAAPSGWTAAQNPAGPSIAGSPNYTPVVAIFYKLSSAEGTETGTVSAPSGTYGWAQIAEYSGGPFTFTGAQSASAVFNTGATSRATGTTGANSIADAVVIAIGHPEDTIGNTSALTTPAGWTSLDLEATNSVENAWSAAYKILSSTGTQSATHSWTTNSYYAGAIAIFEGPSGGGGGTNVDPGAGSVAISGYAPMIGQPKLLTPGAGTLALTGYAPTIGQPHSATPGAGALALTGFAPTVAQPKTVGPGAGALAITGYAPTVTQSQAITPTTGALSITGYAPGISQPKSVNPGAGAIAITGYPPTVQQTGAQSVSPGVGALLLTGYAPTITQGAPTWRETEVDVRGASVVSFKPLLQRILEERSAQRVKPAKERAQKRAKFIEVEAAKVALQDSGETEFQALMQQWLAQRPVFDRGLDPQRLFLGQVAFRIQQMQAEEQARAVVAMQLAAEEDEEEALLALLLA